MELEGILAIIFIFGVPSVAIATHLVIRPLVRDIMGVKAGKASEAERAQLEKRIERLEDAIGDIDTQVHRLVEAERFRRELEASPRRRESTSDL